MGFDGVVAAIAIEEPASLGEVLGGDQGGEGNAVVVEIEGGEVGEAVVDELRTAALAGGVDKGVVLDEGVGDILGGIEP